MADNPKHIPPGAVEVSPQVGDAEQAQLESLAVTEKRLDADKKVKKHHRRESLLKFLFWVSAALIFTLGGLLIVTVATWFWHLLTPSTLHYLEDDQVRNIEKIIIAGVILSLLPPAVKVLIADN